MPTRMKGASASAVIMKASDVTNRIAREGCGGGRGTTVDMLAGSGCGAGLSWVGGVGLLLLSVLGLRSQQTEKKTSNVVERGLKLLQSLLARDGN